MGALAFVLACGETGSPAPPLDDVPPGERDAEAADSGSDADMPAQDAAIEIPLAEVTCQSQSFWGGGDAPSAEMNPGLACRSCHQQAAPELAYYFAGTVFNELHGQDLCNTPPPEGARVEILNEASDVVLTLRPNAAGNFSSKTIGPTIPLPYRARVVVGERTKVMQTLQHSGDCNRCHSEQGQEGAPGRIVWPLE